MVIGFGSGQVILLDCYALLNLYATQRMVEILQTLHALVKLLEENAS